ncbi:porphobilinogen deaminase [Terfezia boudieri ATCC MYA-4762]|uniref:hydroxymethylbilane synthase n=1 Tax=Terfezia boudieri ATCC MYA-4762 TaxID=1051890 RepID=A0A3N4M8A6_9PEZI|nr:porphobilinogen deaminase [Terfezia boudieri ATCC MYA-4762]
MSSNTPRIIKIGSRNSKLALIQTEIVIAELNSHFPHLIFEVTSMATNGDKILDKPLSSIGAKSLWVKELEELLLEGSVDLIVHSLKDIPTQLPAGCRVDTILAREDPRDVVVMKAGSTYTDISQLPPGSVIGTSSVRRSAQLTRAYPHLKFENIRGNIGTRLSKLDDPEKPYACLVLAAAGLLRLGLDLRITQYLSPPTVFHAVGQGALGAETRTEDWEIEVLVEKLIHKPTHLKCIAERSLMRTLEGGCSVPIGVDTKFVGGDESTDPVTQPKQMQMAATVVAVDGMKASTVDVTSKEDVQSVDEAEEFGREVARRLIEEGAGEILKAIELNRAVVGA